MEISRDALHKLVDSLPEAEIAIIPKQPIGSEFAESIRRGLAHAEAGDTVVCRDYVEMVENLLDWFQTERPSRLRRALATQIGPFFSTLCD